ncbi:echinoderm microtubule-associated protein-like 2 [Symsagittifera roscoffensis]|uniref:echinoderm microtubule-associated protein-like 2 n=1 Tax=Symsagittifera roscoffensis TaxID=84072 RepID=UPI00307C51D4
MYIWVPSDFAHAFSLIAKIVVNEIDAVRPVTEGVEGRESVSGNDEGVGRAPIYVSCTFDNGGNLYTGDSDGKLIVWGPEQSIIRHIDSCHEGAVFTVVVNEESSQVLTGGRDGFIHVWDMSSNPLRKLMTFKVPENHGTCRMVALSDNQLFVGSTANSILSTKVVVPMATQDPSFSEGDNSSSKEEVEAATVKSSSSLHVEWTVITQGHYEQIRGLASLRNWGLQGGHFITAGYDGMVLMVNSEQRKLVWKHALQNTAPTCIDIHDDAATIAMGTKDGSLILVKVKSNQSSPEVKVKVAHAKINCIKFSKDYSSLALGSQDGNTYIFRSKDFRDFEKTPPQELAILKGGAAQIDGGGGTGSGSGSTAGIQTLDWSVQKRQGQYIIRTLAQDSTLKYWNGGTGEQWEESEMRSVEWMSVSCKYEYNTTGLFEQQHPPMLLSPSAIASVSRQSELQYLAAATHRGTLLLANYPCLTSSSKVPPKLLEERAFHSKLSALQFVSDSCLVVTSQADHCIQQWKIA